MPTDTPIREMHVDFQLNGKSVSIDIPVRTNLADCIRHHCGQTGTHVACEHGVCGACTVIIDGEAVRSCLTLAVQAEGRRITTIEGLGPGQGALSALQASFRKHHALQCGFCTPGFLTTAHTLLTNEPDASRERIRDVLSGNLCRCTGYMNIIEAVYAARSAYRRADAAGAQA